MRSLVLCHAFHVALLKVMTQLSNAGCYFVEISCCTPILSQRYNRDSGLVSMFIPMQFISL